MLHEIRSDYAQIMSVMFLLIAGPGPWSVDAILARGRRLAGRPEMRSALQEAPAHGGKAALAQR